MGYYRTGRLSRKVRWLAHKPVAVTVGDLYFEVEMPNGTQWARVVGGSRRWRSWWAFHILNRTDAVRVTEVYS